MRQRELIQGEGSFIYMQGVKVVSEANTKQHWGAKKRRADAQREVTWASLKESENLIPELPVDITLVRVGPRVMDDDNLRSAFKAIRDEIADFLIPEKTQGNQSKRWADDSDPRLSWSYSQRKSSRGLYAVEIQIYPRGRNGD